RHISDKGEELPHFGRFAVLERGSKIQQTWMSRHTRGLESLVTVTLKKKGDDTLLTLVHANLPDDEFGKAHDGGWKHYLGIFEKRFAAK
ncbi:MAG: SRPBCC domain-containing protein, partial [Spirochaetia bacterium]|nr:SRPBCC domain-containing protein [Spirochaetia bacterium]